jgi:hypothetical protein
VLPGPKNLAEVQQGRLDYPRRHLWEWTIYRPIKQSEGRGDAPSSKICRALFHGEESFFPN